MFRLKNESILLSTQIFLRNFSKTSKNLYDVLEITPKATQAEVKASYYKLSKQYHPDVNKDNANAADKFRLITEAYEVLGNYRLRKLYDRGIIHTAGKDFAHHSAPEEKTQAYDDIADHPHDDPQTKFYKSRLRTAHTRPGHKIYNFDEWTAQHYSDTFANSRKGRDRSDLKRDRNTREHVAQQSSNLTIGVITLAIMFFMIAELCLKENLDRADAKKQQALKEGRN